MKLALRLTTLLTAAALSACATTVPSAPPSDEQACPTPGRWLAPGTGQALTTPQALTRVKDADVVLLGETHVAADHHRWQLQTIAQLHAQHPDLVLGFEAFPRRVQPVLDQWVAGELTEQEFLQQSDWNTVWRYDPALYMPLFHYARLNGVPMVALNVDRKLRAQVSHKGWRGVPQDERLGLGDPAPASPAYRALLNDVFGRHGTREGEPNGKPGPDQARIDNFIDVQLVWDRAMAEAAASTLKQARAAGRDPLVVGIIGRGHLDYGYGVPHQLKDLGVRKVAVLEPWNPYRPCPDLKNEDGVAVADLVFGLPTMKQPPQDGDKPKLGVMIERGDGGVLVHKVLPDTVAAAIGLKEGDLIIRAAGRTVTEPDALIDIIKATLPGTWLPLQIKRGTETQNLTARFPAPMKGP